MVTENAPAGLRSVLLRVEPGDQDALITELWQCGTLGIIEEADGLRAFFLEADLTAILGKFTGQIVETRAEGISAAPEFAKQDWDPIAVGRRFWIAPSWVEDSTPPERIRLAIDNPNAFGSGRHESTQLVLKALEELVPLKGTVLDIGCGSGILSQAAILLGAAKVFACDIHEDAIGSAQAQLPSGLFLGSADAVRSQTGDIVIANISAKVIDALAWELSRVTKPDGVLILAGFIQERTPMHFTPEQVTQQGDWLCWLCRADSISGDVRAPVSHAHPLQWW